MSDMKCPFCQQELDYDDLLGSCINEHCEESFDMVGTESLWQKVINLKQEIDRTRKALDVAVDAIKNATEYLSNQEPLVDVMAMNLYIDLSKALEQITTEQKEVK